MATKTKETPVEGEVVEEIKINSSTDGACCRERRTSGPGMFFGIIFLFWGVALLADTYLGINLSENLWPMLAIVFGAYLIINSFRN